MELTSAQKQAYFQARLPGQKLSSDGRGSLVQCIFHDDRKPSLSVNVEKGVWKCFSGCGQGGVLDFEKKFSSCDDETAWANIADICGMAQQRFSRSAPEKVYVYRDEDRNELFEKLRFPGKRFSQRTRDSQGNSVYNLSGVRKVLYNLPEVITANTVAITEGEKDADNLAPLGKLLSEKFPNTRFAATTNFDGAGKWLPQYSAYLTGKQVMIFEDNDQPGREHAALAAASVSPSARSVRVIRLPGLPEKGDVSDYLAAHSVEELLAEIKKAPVWRPAQSTILVPAPQFLESFTTEIDWMVHGVIQCGSNGFICALPKVGKSWAAVDLALSLALGLPWIGFDIPRPVKTALITREDNPVLTKWRMNRLLAGKQRLMPELNGRLYVNSREQSPEFRLDRPELLAGMIAELKRVEPEFVILDVFNVLHAADENDNTEMRAILDEVNRLRSEVGCSIGMVHHFNKNSEGTLTQRIRGAGAIAGWAE